MEHKLALWVGVPFIGVAWTLAVVVAFVPGVIHGRLALALLLVLAASGAIVLVIRIFARAGSPALDTLYPVAGLLIAVAVAFHQEVGSVARGVFAHVSPGGAMSDGTHFTRAEDEQYHVRLTVEGSELDFLVDPGSPFNVLMPDVPERIGINPSSLIYGERIEFGPGRHEYAASVVLPRALLGSAVVENVPFKVTATNRGQNVLGKPFLDQLGSWEIDGDTLILVR